MAPVTRSSLHGRSISREGSWQIPTLEDLPPEEVEDEPEVTGDAAMVKDETTEEEDSGGASDDDPFHEHQGMSVSLLIPRTLFLTSA